MLRRRFVTTFGGNSSSSSSKRFCSSSILPDHQNSTTSSINTHQGGKKHHLLSKEQILGERWRCSNFVQQQQTPHQQQKSEMSSSSTTKTETTHQKDEPRWTPSSSTGTGILSSAFRGLVNKITRRDEMEEEDEIRRIAEAKSKLKKKQQNTDEDDSSSSSGSQQLPTLEDLKINRSPDIEAIDQFGNVNWGIYERLDVSIRWVSPLDWNVNTRVSENFVAIQCVPPPPQLEMDESEFSSSTNNSTSINNNNNQQQHQNSSSSSSTPSIHGLSVSNFVYLSKVPPQVSANDLLKQFLTQFHRSVGRSSVVVASSTFTEEQITPANHDSCAMCREIVELSGFDVPQPSTSSNDEKLKTDPKTGKPIPKTACAVCELVFKPPNASSNNNQQKSSQMNQQQEQQRQARALCKVFFHRSRKRHTVVVFAVPDDEWNQVKELVKHAVLCVGELHHHPTGKMNY